VIAIINSNEQIGDYIAIHAKETLDRIEIFLQAPTHLLPAAQAQHCAATLSHVLGEIIHHPDLPFADISLMSPQGLQQIFHWNRTAPAVVSRCLHQIVNETAQARPDALAIDGADGRMTYGELQAHSNRLAQHLVQLGVGPEVAVPLFFEKSKWAIVTMIAVVKAGGVIVNLDAKQPLPRLRGLLAQLQAPLVVTSSQHAGLWAGEFHVVVVSEDALDQLPTAAGAPVADVTPQNALYIIFTSGSTGTPKGCVVEHESFLTAAAQHVQAGNILPTSRVLQMTPYTFDVSMLEIFTTLTTGACICFCGDDEAARGIAHIINHLQITWTFMTPSLVRLIDPASVPTLKTLALGGEGLGRIDVTTWADKLHLINGDFPSFCSAFSGLSANSSNFRLRAQ
jgi:non-ribosomal peptide synthetase component F